MGAERAESLLILLVTHNGQRRGDQGERTWTETTETKQKQDMQRQVAY